MKWLVKHAYLIVIILLITFLVQSNMGIDGFTRTADFERVKTVEEDRKSVV